MQKSKVLVYTTRQLKKNEYNYHTHDLGLSTLVLMLKIWQHYLYVEKCRILIDHKSLKYL